MSGVDWIASQIVKSMEKLDITAYWEWSPIGQEERGRALVSNAKSYITSMGGCQAVSKLAHPEAYTTWLKGSSASSRSQLRGGVIEKEDQEYHELQNVNRGCWNVSP